MAKNSQLSGWSILRAVIPPWQDLDDPLVQYDIRHRRRAGRRPWMAIVLGYLTLIALNIYFAGQLFADDPIDYQNLLQPVLTIGVTGLVVTIIYGHWRLLLAVSAKATAIIAARRRSGDWDLIAITPVEKSRWLR